jgi:hypothetical protein
VGQEALDLLLGGQDPEMVTTRPSDALKLAEGFPQGACLLLHNDHCFVDTECVSQFLLNLLYSLQESGSLFR